MQQKRVRSYGLFGTIVFRTNKTMSVYELKHNYDFDVSELKKNISIR